MGKARQDLKTPVSITRSTLDTEYTGTSVNEFRENEVGRVLLRDPGNPCPVSVLCTFEESPSPQPKLHDKLETRP